MLTILLTTKCNFRCDHCLFSCTMKGDNITDDTMINLEPFINECGGVNVLGGEPTLNPKFDKLITTISDVNPYNYYRIVSNGSFIYSRQKTRKLINALLYLKDRQHEQVELTISNDAFHEAFWQEEKHLDYIKYALEDAGLLHDDKLYFCISERKEVDVLSLGRAKYLGLYCGMDNKGASCNNQTYERDNNDYIPLYDELTVFPDGRIFPCCQAVEPIGNINNNTFDEISTKLETFYKLLKPDLKYGDCQNCAVINRDAYQAIM